MPAPDLDDQIRRAAATLLAGGIVGMPTETVYGLAANALDAIAVAKIFETKRRPHFDPLIVHVPDISKAAELAESFPDDARRLAQAFWPGPLTIVLPKRPIMPDIVTSGLPSVALRVPDHPVAQRLLREIGVPLAAPSANRFGSVSPTTAQHVRDELGDAVPIVLDGGPSRTGVESTIVSFLDAQPALLRPGGLPLEMVESLIGPVRRVTPGDKVVAPGMLPRHYAPRTRLILTQDTTASIWKGRVGLLTLRRPLPENTKQFAAVEILSPVGNLREAAANLFAAMRRLDAAGLDVILAEPAPDEGLGLAINDRLRRASAT
jgi:L-threonylcarbamoyladenylate synthase